MTDKTITVDQPLVDVASAPVKPVIERKIKWNRLAIPVSVTLITIAGMLVAVDFDELVDILSGVDYILLTLAALKVPLQVYLWTLRWHLVIQSREFSIPFKHTFMAVIVRGFFNNITPGAGTGGEPIGAYYLSKKTGMTFKQTMGSTASERLCQGIVFVGIVLISSLVIVPYLPVSTAVTQSVFIGVLAFCLFVALMVYLSLFKFQHGRAVLKHIIHFIAWLIPPLNRKWNLTYLEDHLDDWHREFKAFLINKNAILWTTVLTIGAWFLDLLQPYLLFKALHVDVPLWLILMNATIVRLGGVFAVLPGGAGVIEGMNVGLYAALSSIPGEAIVAETILFRAFDAWLLWLISGILASIGLSTLTIGGENASDKT